MRYFQLESSVAGTWKLVRYYKAGDFRTLLDHTRPSGGQRLRAAARPSEGAVVWVFNTKGGLMRWVD